MAKVKFTNSGSSPVAYKLKTNAPQKYSVRPVFGVVAAGTTVKVFGREKVFTTIADSPNHYDTLLVVTIFIVHTTAVSPMLKQQQQQQHENQKQQQQQLQSPPVSVGGPKLVRRISNAATNSTTSSSAGSSPGSYPVPYHYSGSTVPSTAPSSPSSTTTALSTPRLSMTHSTPLSFIRNSHADETMQMGDEMDPLELPQAIIPRSTAKSATSAMTYPYTKNLTLEPKPNVSLPRLVLATCVTIIALLLLHVILPAILTTKGAFMA
ncbi:hypothetical protein BGZ94_007902 [Podila epigama]|nr:hypothetical protein BGZ94_007902 [Podila epigama]